MRRRICLLLAGLLLLTFLNFWHTPPFVAAQSDSDVPAYWRHNASSEITKVLIDDLFGRGEQTIAIATIDGTLTLLRPNGNPLWTTPFQLTESITHMAVVDDLLVYATPSGVAAIDATQAEVWSQSQQPSVILEGLYATDRNTLLIHYGNGALHHYSAAGELLWQFAHPQTPNPIANSLLELADINRDGQQELLLSYAVGSEGVQLAQISLEDGATLYSIMLDEPVTVLASGELGQPSMRVAVGTATGRLHLLDSQLRPKWTPRTLNRPITSLLFSRGSDYRPILLAGSSSGKLIAFGTEGQRLWDKAICETDERVGVIDQACPNGVYAGVQHIASADQTLALTLQRADAALNQLLLIDRDFNVLAQYDSTALPNQPVFADSNGDGRPELLLPTFSSFELLSAGTNARIASEVWSYPLQARPNAIVVDDIDRDGIDDLIIAGADGRLHRLRPNSNAAVWIQPPEGDIVELAMLRAPLSLETVDGGIDPADLNLPGSDFLLAAYNANESSPTAQESGKADNRSSHINLLDANGKLAWAESLSFDAQIVTMLMNDAATPTIAVGLDDGRVLAYRLVFEFAESGGVWQAEPAWEQVFNEPIVAGAMLQQPGEEQARFVLASANSVVRFDQNGQSVFRSDGFSTSPNCASSSEMLYLLTNGGRSNLVCLRNRTLEVWEGWLGNSTRGTAATTSSYEYSPLGFSRWQRLSGVDASSLIIPVGQQAEPDVVLTGSETERFEAVSAAFSGDVTGDRRSDMVLGFEDGRVLLDLNEAEGGVNSADSFIELSGAVRAITSLKDPNAASNLVLITDAGFVRLFGFRPNHPPLVTAPNARDTGGQYDIELTVFDVENSQINVRLDLFDSVNNVWIRQETELQSTRPGDRLRWQVEPPVPNEPVRYRFSYADGENDHVGQIEPVAGPVFAVSTTPTWLTAMPAVVVGLILLGGFRLISMRQRPSSRAWRFLLDLEQTPTATLTEMARQYDGLNGDPDFFINLANYARQRENSLLAGLSDGLYLLADRPTAGIDVLNGTFKEIAANQHGPLTGADQWQALFLSAKRFIDAETLTELTLMQPSLDRLTAPGLHWPSAQPLLNKLRLIFDALSDSERVDTVGDRLAYLSDAETLLRQLESDVAAAPIDLPTVVISAVGQRWRGLARAAAESLRGRARIDVRLKTKRVAPEASAELVLELVNNGLSLAEQVQVTLHVTDTETPRRSSQIIPSLSPGWKRSVLFSLPVPNQASFRVAFSIEYRDRLSESRSFEYADIVQVLAPSGTFSEVRNPYSPGTPLRKDSQLFFGRNNLFNFIAGEAERASQQHVLILVGQRRTGKTSALLRLNQHLPDHLVPVYIDCQSLGVLPGMTAFFQDLAWQIADTLDERDIFIDVPDLNQAGTNPAKWFQHTFVPAVRDKLPTHTKLVLVFDEFEAFENLVTDGILPRTIFNFLRHLMQHGEGLSFIFVGTHKLEEMTTDYWSVLFNIALYQEISYLDEQAALALITEPVAPNLVYDDLALDKILRVTAGHPYFLQLVCYSLVKRANTVQSGYVTISDVNATIEEMLSLGEVHFAYIWQRSDSAERIVLLAVAHLIDKETAFRPSDVVAAIAPYELSLTPATVTTALENLVRRNIMRELNDGANTLYEIKLGLVGYWIERSKSLNKLYSRAAVVVE